MLLADKGYYGDSVRQTAGDRYAWANIPPNANRKEPIVFSHHLYKARDRIERFCNKIKHFRRIATRYDKDENNFLAARKLVSVRLWLRVN